MKPEQLHELIATYQDRVQTYAAQKKYLIAGLPSAKQITDLSAVDLNASLIHDADAAKKLLDSNWLAQYPTAVCIDFGKAVDLYNSSTQAENERIDTAFTMARVNFMGTDGIRGKVVTHTAEHFIADLLTDNAFTPDLVEITSFSFAMMLIDTKLIQPGNTSVIGNDGRDLAYDWILNNAVRRGFCRAGLNVLDLGIVPTAIIPWKMLQLNHKSGACLTASHNPSNQNGIKFFIEGKKLVPEGEIGDYVLSSYMYTYCMIEKIPEPTGDIQELNCVEDSVKWMLSTLPQTMQTALKGIDLIFDSANGASDEVGRKVLDALGANYHCVNEKCTGDNINRSVGVAEIEGNEFFDGKSYDSHIPTIKTIFDRGRAAPEGTVYGIALDGDGDRGFLLYYNKKTDIVHVLDGDKCGYILAEYLIKEHKLDGKDFWFLSTIESDIMTASAAQKNLGLNLRVVSVGDKWIGNFAEGEILVGVEISGHLIFPIKVIDHEGNEKTLLSGVGLLTGLVSLAAIRALNLSEERIIEPFEPGFSKTFYVFCVDKTQYYRGSPIWNEDKELIESEMRRLIEKGALPTGATIVYENKEDLNVLYLNIMNGDSLLGVLFMRNSGTEDKNAIYVKGEKEFEHVLCEIGSRVQVLHTRKMKNESRIEYVYEKAIMEILKEQGKTTVSGVLAHLNDAGHVVTESDLFGVVYGLKKEGRVTLEGEKILPIVLAS